MTFTYGLSSELLTPGQSQDGKEGSIQAGWGTEGGTLLLGQAAGPVPAGSSQPGAFPDGSRPEAHLQNWAHFSSLSTGPGPSQSLSPYSCLSRSLSPSQMAVHTGPEMWAGAESCEGMGFMLSDEATATSPHPAHPPGRRCRGGSVPLFRVSGCLGLTSAFLRIGEGVTSNHLEPSRHCQSPPPSRAGLALCPCLGPCGEPVCSVSGDRVLAVSRGGAPTLQRLRVSSSAKGALPILRHAPSVGPIEW